MTDMIQYYVKATDPSSQEQVAFACSNMDLAHAKAAELRMRRYRDVVMSVAHPALDVTPKP